MNGERSSFPVHRSLFSRRSLMIRRASVLLLITLFLFACKTTSDDPNARAKRGAGAGAAAGAECAAGLVIHSAKTAAEPNTGSPKAPGIDQASGHRKTRRKRRL